MATPQIRLNSARDSGAVTVELSISGFTSDIYSYQWGVSNVQTSASTQMQNLVQGWTPAVSSNAASSSLIALDISLTRPLGSAGSVLAKMSANGFAEGASMHLDSVMLTQMKTGAQAQELNFNSLPVNWYVNGPVGVTLSDYSTASEYEGGDGVDTLVFQKNQGSYTMVNDSVSLSITDKSTGATDKLTKFDRVQFADVGIAYDLDSAAGSVAKILGALWGSSSVNSHNMVGIGLSLFDQGLDAKQVMQIALPARLGEDYHGRDVIELLYRNLVNQSPNNSEVKSWEDQVGVGRTYDSYESLALFAADLSLNTDAIGLVGLKEFGVTYAP